MRHISHPQLRSASHYRQLKDEIVWNKIIEVVGDQGRQERFVLNKCTSDRGVRLEADQILCPSYLERIVSLLIQSFSDMLRRTQDMHQSKVVRRLLNRNGTGRSACDVMAKFCVGPVGF